MTDEESQAYHDTKQKDLQKQLEAEEINEEEYYKFLDQFPKTKVIDVRHYNDTLWEQAELPKPVVFICQKNQEEKSAVKLVRNIQEVQSIRKEIRFLAEPAYFTDLDNVKLLNIEHQHNLEWLILFYPKAEAEKHPLIKHFKSWARSQLFKVDNLKLAILDSTQITMLNLEQGIPHDQFLRFYYFKYENGQESKILKHRMLNVQNPNQVNTALQWIQNGEWDQYFFSEPEKVNFETLDDRDKISKKFKKLVRTNYFSTIEDRSGHILIVARKRGSIKKFSEIVDEFFEKIKILKLKNSIEFFHINVELNDLDLDMQAGVKFMFYHKNKEEIQTSFNLDSVDALIRFLAESVPELEPLIDGSAGEL